MDPTEIPRLDQPPTDAPPRALQFRDTAGPRGFAGRRGSPGRHRSPGQRGFLNSPLLGRRGFLAVLGAGAMTLALTALEWLPLARYARAEPGTEYPDCGAYGDGPGGPICVGAPYSPRYCGSDDWFRTGCYERQEGGEVCYEPAAICRAAGRENEARNAWRWEADGISYRCADGKAYYDGAPNPEILICNATLSSPEPSPEPEPEPTTTPPPTSTSRRPWPSSLLPELPLLPR
jgi:hypothetical protein